MLLIINEENKRDFWFGTCTRIIKDLYQFYSTPGLLLAAPYMCKGIELNTYIHSQTGGAGDSYEF